MTWCSCGFVLFVCVYVHFFLILDKVNMTLNLSSPCFGKDWGYKHVSPLCCRFVKIHLSIGKFLQTFL